MSVLTRSETALFEKPVGHFLPIDPLKVGIVAFQIPVLSNAADRGHFYTIYDEVRTKQPKGGSRHRCKPFEHYKAFRSRAGVATSHWDGQPGGYEGICYWRASVNGTRFGIPGWSATGALSFPYGEPGIPNSGLPPFILRDNDPGFIPMVSGYDRLKQLSLNTMLPKVKSELSLVNSLIELKDFKTLPRTVASVSNYLVSTGARLNLRIRQAKRLPLRDSLRAASDGYLQLKFNVLPLLSDILGIHAALSRTAKRVNDLVARSGRVRVSHYTHHFNEYADSDSRDGLYYPWSPQGGPSGYPASRGYLVHRLGFRRIVVHEPTIFHAQLKYNYNYTQYQTENAQLLGYLDAFGVNLNPSIIWNALPWSFVVDWVIGVSRFLDRLSKSNLEPMINIIEYMWSVKRLRRIYFHSEVVGLGDKSAGAAIWSHPVSIESSYRRESDTVDVGSIQTSGLNSTEFSLGAALVLSRRRRARR